MADALMRFAQPFGFWLGIAAAGVLAAHLVRRRARRRQVPFLPLWAVLLEGKRAGFGASLARLLDLFLLLLVCSAVALAAAGPYLPGTQGSVRDLVLVLDGGVGLRAQQRETKLRRVAGAEIRRRAEGTKFVLIGVRDEGSSVWSGTSRDQALRALRAHRAGWLAARAGEALDLARASARGLRNPDLVFCTARRVAPDGFRVRAFGGEVRNAGITGLEVLADPEGSGRIARLTLRGSGAVTIQGHWSGELQGRRVVDLALPPHGRVTLTVRSAEDGFWCDDSVYLLLPERKLPRVLVVAAQEPSPFLTAALQSLEQIGAIEGPLGKTTPEHASSAAGSYDLLIFDRCAPSQRMTGTRAVYLAPPPGALPFKVGEQAAAPTLFDVASKHPLLTGFDLARIPPRQARAIHGGEALAYASPGPVLAVGPAWVALGFDPDRCVFAASPAYPLFLRNCLAHWEQALPQPTPEFFRMGERAPVSGPSRFEGHGRGVVRDRLLGPPGFWSIADKTLPVSLLQTIDLKGPAQNSDPLPPVGEPARPDRPLTSAFAALAIGLLLIAWWLFWRP